jgi:hypothetical protein
MWLRLLGARANSSRQRRRLARQCISESFFGQLQGSLSSASVALFGFWQELVFYAVLRDGENFSFWGHVPKVVNLCHLLYFQHGACFNSLPHFTSGKFMKVSASRLPEVKRVRAVAQAGL